MYRVSKVIKFDAAHRLLDYEGKCKNVHGHEYILELTLESKELNLHDFVIDFNDFKKMKDWINNYWDHVYIGGSGDSVAKALVAEGSRIFILEGNSTVENMSKYIFDIAKKFYNNDRVKVHSVSLHETSSSKCVYTEDK